MSRPLVGLLIAVLATFVAAPSMSLAAANSLSAAAVSPTSGGAGTVVTLAVTYNGSHRTTSVRAMVGAISVPLVGPSGTDNAGRWSGATTPPAGTWAVTFTAKTDRGNAPSLDGATVTILAAVAPPSVYSKPSVAPSASEPIGDGAGGAVEGGSAHAAPRASASSASHVSPSLSGTGSSAPVPERASRGEDAWLLPTVMTLIVTLTSLLAIAGAGMLVAGRRRQEAEAATAPSMSPAEAEDPIMAAMGIAPETALRARRARRLRDAMDERAATGDGLTELDPPMKPTRTRPRRSPKG